ncbi:MAG: KTSC domain-containing protein [Patescibacteria group bacterium]|jgi:hypothetical protein
MYKEQITSSIIDSIGYDAELQILEIQFKRGAIYQYFNVPFDVYKELMSAKSIGSYFMKNINKKYVHKRI